MREPSSEPTPDTRTRGARARGVRTRGARTRGVLLFLAATILNFLTAAVIFFGFLALWGLVLAPWLKLPASSLVIFAAFILAVAGSGIIYRAAVKLFLERERSKKSG